MSFFQSSWGRQPRRWISLVIGSLILGCNAGGTDEPRVELSPSSIPQDDELKQQLDDVLDFTYEKRHLNTRDHAAWQILHGALAFKRQFMVEDNGEMVSAVNHIVSGGHMTGWTTRPGSLDPATGRQGLQALLELGTKTGQGHWDQWLAILAQCELKPTQPILVDGHEYTMADYVEQAKLDVARNVDREFSWTLIGLTTYLPTEAKWLDADGVPRSIEELVHDETEREIGDGACGGTHRLIGITMALNRHLAQGGKLEGPWKEADQRIQEAIADARQFQNADGSFSTNYLRRGGTTPDLAQNLGTTGHVLEFLTLATTDEQLREPWIKLAVANLCLLFEKTKRVDLECGALYHAAHALVLYRERAYGPREFPRLEKPNADEQTAQREKVTAT